MNQRRDQPIQISKLFIRTRTNFQSRSYTRYWAVAATLVLLFLRPVFSQEKDADSASQPSANMDKVSLKINPVTGIASVSATNYTPLTSHERWKLYFKQNYWSMGAYFGPCVSALLVDQTTGEPPEWGGGIGGYGRRLGSRLGTAIVQGTFQAPVAALLGEDTRYISSGQEGFKKRAKHVVLFSFVTYNTQGHKTLNIANIGGFYASSAVSTLWLPQKENVGLYTLTDGTKQAGLTILINMIQEFWPDIRQKLRRGP
jgi:hypothetical protein